MKPIERLKITVTDIDCIKALVVIIPIVNQIITRGLKVQITEVWLAVLESKAVRSDKLDHYMEQIFEAMRVKRYWPTPLAGEEVPVISVDEAKDSRGMIMDVTLAVTVRLSENQLKRIKSSSSFG